MSRTARILIGDYDCSISVITSHAAAGIPTGGATTTRDIRRCYESTGMWKAMPVSFIASPGDLYLAEGSHVAMCKQQVPDELMEFSHNEQGGYYNGQVGDQLNNLGAGAESHTRSYYNGGWNCIMHFLGDRQRAADAVKIMNFMCNDPRFGYTMSIPGRGGDPSLGYATISLDGDAPEPMPVDKFKISAAVNDGFNIYYPEFIEDRKVWQIRADNPFRYMSISVEPGVIEARAFDGTNKWLGIINNPSDISDHNYGCIGDNKDITAIQLNMLSPNSDYAIFYRVETELGWYDWMEDGYELDKNGNIKPNGDDFAGDKVNPIYGIEFYIAKATY